MVSFQILERDRAVVNDDRVKFEVLISMEAHPLSDYGPDCFGFQTVKKAVRQIWGLQDVIVTPGLHCIMFIFCLCIIFTGILQAVVCEVACCINVRPGL